MQSPGQGHVLSNTAGLASARRVTLREYAQIFSRLPNQG
jgi:hypothetical protein